MSASRYLAFSAHNLSLKLARQRLKEHNADLKKKLLCSEAQSSSQVFLTVGSTFNIIYSLGLKYLLLSYPYFPIPLLALLATYSKGA